jgi:predicted phosphodiesterase
VRIAIVSDIHGNLTALEAVLTDLRSMSPDLVVQAGDLAVNGSSSADVIDLVRSLKWPGVHGNTDEMLWRPERLKELAMKAPERHGLRRVLFQHMAPATREAIGSARLDWLKSLPARWSDGELAVVHAAPTDLWRAPLANAPAVDFQNVYGPLGTQFVIYGHIHRPFVRHVGALTVANAGSVSLSYDGDPRAAYAILENGDVRIRRVEYDVEREIAALRRVAYPYVDWLSEILRTGRYSPPVSPRTT